MSEETIEKDCQGNCVKCDSDNIEYGEHEFDDNLILFDYKCNDCGTTGVEVSMLVYGISRTR